MKEFAVGEVVVGGDANCGWEDRGSSVGTWLIRGLSWDRGPLTVVNEVDGLAPTAGGTCVDVEGSIWETLVDWDCGIREAVEESSKSWWGEEESVECLV